MVEPPPTQFDVSRPRRDFLKRIFGVLIGGLVGLVPIAAGIWVLFDPLRRKTASSAGFIEVARLLALPANGQPRRFSVIADRTDAWNKYSRVPIGAVYLQRTGHMQVAAFNVVCPHLGCFVNAREDGTFACPCHDSEFDADGNIIPTTSSGRMTVSPRGLDTLEVRIENDVVLVRFQDFRTGTQSKIPRS